MIASAWFPTVPSSAWAVVISVLFLRLIAKHWRGKSSYISAFSSGGIAVVSPQTSISKPTAAGRSFHFRVRLSKPFSSMKASRIRRSCSDIFFFSLKFPYIESERYGVQRRVVAVGFSSPESSLHLRT